MEPDTPLAQDGAKLLLNKVSEKSEGRYFAINNDAGSRNAK